MTAKEAADYLGLTVKDLNNMRQAGNGPRYAKPGTSPHTRCVYERADLDAWKAREQRKVRR